MSLQVRIFFSILTSFSLLPFHHFLPFSSPFSSLYPPLTLVLSFPTFLTFPFPPSCSYPSLSPQSSPFPTFSLPLSSHHCNTTFPNPPHPTTLPFTPVHLDYSNVSFPPVRRYSFYSICSISLTLYRVPSPIPCPIFSSPTNTVSLFHSSFSNFPVLPTSILSFIHVRT